MITFLIQSGSTPNSNGLKRQLQLIGDERKTTLDNQLEAAKNAFQLATKNAIKENQQRRIKGHDPSNRKMRLSNFTHDATSSFIIAEDIKDVDTHQKGLEPDWSTMERSMFVHNGKLEKVIIQTRHLEKYEIRSQPQSSSKCRIAMADNGLSPEQRQQAVAMNLRETKQQTPCLLQQPYSPTTNRRCHILRPLHDFLQNSKLRRTRLPMFSSRNT